MTKVYLTAIRILTVNCCNLLAALWDIVTARYHENIKHTSLVLDPCIYFNTWERLADYSTRRRKLRDGTRKRPLAGAMLSEGSGVL